MKKYLLFLVLTGLVLFQSCISLTRKLTLNKDGSGKETIQVDFSRNFMDMIVGFASALDTARYQEIRDSIYNDENFIQESNDDYQNIEGVTVDKISSRTNPDSSKTLDMSLSFNSISGLQNIYNKEAGEDGNITNLIFQRNGDIINYDLTIRKRPVENPQDTSMTGLRNSIAEMMKNNYYTMEVEFPYTIKSTNGEMLNQNTVRWKYVISELYNLDSVVTMNAVLNAD
ncbi:MAG: hypothetical protein IAE65_01890 [Ignavibacteria bacterium]|nr:hypothetical protein [Ignavibacteria bacterium]